MTAALTSDEAGELRSFAAALASGHGPGPARALAGIVRRHLGWRTFDVLARAGFAAVLGYRRLDGPPWLSGAARRFVPLAALHRAACESLGARRADALARELILKLGLVEWARLLPCEEARRLGRAAFLDLWRSRIKAAMGAHSDDRFELRGPDEMVMTVERCMLRRVFDALGLGHLAPCLCRTDEVHLAGLGPEIRFRRESTLTAGDPVCEFVFRFGASPSPPSCPGRGEGGDGGGCSPAVLAASFAESENFPARQRAGH